MREARQLTLIGQVQGVGLRPYLYRLAHGCQLKGWVENRSGEVVLHIEGEQWQLDQFEQRLLAEKPPLARPEIERREVVPLQDLDQFTIRPSRLSDSPQIHLPADQSLCATCLDELFDPNNRRYHYPFNNCTQCGPRYTLIEALPYDRSWTVMRHFPLCAECQREYSDPLDRRFHAEPIACPRCGPTLQLLHADGRVVAGQPLAESIKRLQQGAIIAVKGVGGYHLICAAADETTLKTLRQRKQRPSKPFAVLLNSTLLQQWQQEQQIEIGSVELTALTEPNRPILLCRKGVHFNLPEAVAPHLGEIGILLPYSPLHALLSVQLGAPLIATSGNISGEPVLLEEQSAQIGLQRIADYFLHHNRTILRPAEDSVMRPIAGRARPLRLGRGDAPLERQLQFNFAQPTLALGGQMKGSIALGWGHRVVLSPHIGDLSSMAAVALFERLCHELPELYRVTPQLLVADHHPGYSSGRYLQRHPTLKQQRVQHHRAHASALYGERVLLHSSEHCDPLPHWLCLSWDGVGVGDRDSDSEAATLPLWGSESFIGYPGHWHHWASLEPFYPIGGEKAAREGWRSGYALAWQIGLTPSYFQSESDLALLQQAWRQRLNCPATTAMGRLFDGVASLLQICHNSSYEGEAPTRLEQIATRALDTPSAERLPIQAWSSRIEGNGRIAYQWQPLIATLLNSTQQCDKRALWFHQQLAELITQQARTAYQYYGITTVGLSGGVFQNRLLTELAQAQLQQAGFTVMLARQIPMNDAGLSFGQLIESHWAE